MANKPILTEEQAEALKELIKVHGYIPTEKIHQIIIKEKLGNGWNRKIFKAANTINNMDFIDALRNGYVVAEAYKAHGELKHYGSSNVDKKAAREQASVYLEEVFSDIYLVKKDRYDNYKTGQYVSKNELVNILNNNEKVAIACGGISVYSTFELPKRQVIASPAEEDLFA